MSIETDWLEGFIFSLSLQIDPRVLPKIQFLIPLASPERQLYSTLKSIDLFDIMFYERNRG